MTALTCPRCARPVLRDRDDYVCAGGAHGTVTPDAARLVTPETARVECRPGQRPHMVNRNRTCPGCHERYSSMGIVAHVRFCWLVRLAAGA